MGLVPKLFLEMVPSSYNEHCELGYKYTVCLFLWMMKMCIKLLCLSRSARVIDLKKNF